MMLGNPFLIWEKLTNPRNEYAVGKTRDREGAWKALKPEQQFRPAPSVPIIPAPAEALGLLSYQGCVQVKTASR